MLDLHGHDEELNGESFAMRLSLVAVALRSRLLSSANGTTTRRLAHGSVMHSTITDIAIHVTGPGSSVSFVGL